MTRRKTEDKNIRKIFKSGSSYAVTIPLEIADALTIPLEICGRNEYLQGTLLLRPGRIRRGKQKVVVKKLGSKIIIEDWK